MLRNRIRIGYFSRPVQVASLTHIDHIDTEMHLTKGWSFSDISHRLSQSHYSQEHGFESQHGEVRFETILCMHRSSPMLK